MQAWDPILHWLRHCCSGRKTLGPGGGAAASRVHLLKTALASTRSPAAASQGGPMCRQHTWSWQSQPLRRLWPPAFPRARGVWWWRPTSSLVAATYKCAFTTLVPCSGSVPPCPTCAPLLLACCLPDTEVQCQQQQQSHFQPPRPPQPATDRYSAASCRSSRCAPWCGVRGRRAHRCRCPDGAAD